MHQQRRVRTSGGVERAGRGARELSRVRVRVVVVFRRPVETHRKERPPADSAGTRASRSLVDLSRRGGGSTHAILAGRDAEWMAQKLREGIKKTCHESAINQGVHVPTPLTAREAAGRHTRTTRCAHHALLSPCRRRAHVKSLVSKHAAEPLAGLLPAAADASALDWRGKAP